MSTEAVAVYLALGLLLPVLVALWARAWGRNPLVWGLVTFFLTPFAFLFVALALAASGRRART